MYCCFPSLVLDTFLCKNSTTLVNGSMCLPSRTYSRLSYKRLNETTGMKQTTNSFYNFLTGGTRQVSLSGVGMGSLGNYGGRRRSEILRDLECHVTVAWRYKCNSEISVSFFVLVACVCVIFLVLTLVNRRLSNSNRTEWSPIRSVIIHCSYHLSSHWLKAYC